MHDIKKEVSRYIAWCKEHNLKPCKGKNLMRYFQTHKR